MITAGEGQTTYTLDVINYSRFLKQAISRLIFTVYCPARLYGRMNHRRDAFSACPNVLCSAKINVGDCILVMSHMLIFGDQKLLGNVKYARYYLTVSMPV